MESLSWIPSSALKIWTYRMLGASIGNRVRIGRGSFIWSSNFKAVKIGDGVTIRDNTRFFCEMLTIEEDAYIESNGYVSGKEFFLGFGSYFGKNMYVDCTSPVRIEEKVAISFTQIYTHSIAYAWVTSGIMKRNDAPVTIKEGSWLAPDLIIGAGVIIGEHASVGARSLVLEDIAPYTLNFGIPCKKIRSIRNIFRQEQNLLDDVKRDLEGYVKCKHPKKTFQFIFHDIVAHHDLTLKQEKNFFLVGNHVDDSIFKKLISKKSKCASAFDLRRQLYFKNDSPLVHEIKHRMRRYGLIFKPYGARVD